MHCHAKSAIILFLIKYSFTATSARVPVRGDPIWETRPWVQQSWHSHSPPAAKSRLNGFICSSVWNGEDGCVCLCFSGMWCCWSDVWHWTIWIQTVFKCLLCGMGGRPKCERMCPCRQTSLTGKNKSHICFFYISI